MKIELKQIEFSERMSQETNCFTANLYIDGKLAGDASNQGHGGPTDYRSYTDEGRELIRKAEEYCKTLPPETHTMGGETFTLDMDLENYIDNLLNQYLREKELLRFRKSMERAMKKSLVIGIPDESYATITFKVPLETIMSSPNKPEVMVNVIKKHVIPKLVDGNILLNTNIPESFLEQAGLSKEHYQPHKKVEVKTTKEQVAKKGKGI